MDYWKIANKALIPVDPCSSEYVPLTNDDVDAFTEETRTLLFGGSAIEGEIDYDRSFKYVEIYGINLLRQKLIGGLVSTDNVGLTRDLFQVLAGLAARFQVNTSEGGEVDPLSRG